MGVSASRGASAPVLETERLRLRPLRAEDIDAQVAMMGDAAFMRHLGGPLGREECWRKLMTCMGLWMALGYGYWAIERRDGGPMIGQVGFADFKRDIIPSIESLPEIGWMLSAEFAGRGYASEAASAAIAWADGALNAPQIIAVIRPTNAASIRVAEKSGLDHREEGMYRDEPVLLFRRASA